MIFDAYSEYYDLLYQDKDYLAETKYINQLIQKWSPNTQSILELGCGTGKHGQLLSNLGYYVTGIENSDSMLTKASQRQRQSSIDSPGSFVALKGDARNISLECKFDTVLSLFHVVSYQTSNDDLKAILNTASRHLKPGGLFIFDVWYGPAVLTTPPETRIKRINGNNLSITRLAEPQIDTRKNIVQVDYTVIIRNKNGETLPDITETHKMRYFFTPELELAGQQFNLNLLHHEEWMTGRPASTDTWGVVYIAQQLAK